MKYLLLTAALLFSVTAIAQDHTHHTMNIAFKGDKNAASEEYYAANLKMHDAMNIEFSDDADIDFLKGMIAHHQGAVDMARTQLKYGKDPKVKRLARQIIRAQNLEIKWMKKWLKQAEEAKLGWNDEEWFGEEGSIYEY